MTYFNLNNNICNKLYKYFNKTSKSIKNSIHNSHNTLFDIDKCLNKYTDSQLLECYKHNFITTLNKFKIPRKVINNIIFGFMEDEDNQYLLSQRLIAGTAPIINFDKVTNCKFKSVYSKTFGKLKFKEVHKYYKDDYLQFIKVVAIHEACHVIDIYVNGVGDESTKYHNAYWRKIYEPMRFKLKDVDPYIYRDNIDYANFSKELLWINNIPCGFIG